MAVTSNTISFSSLCTDKDIEACRMQNHVLQETAWCPNQRSMSFQARRNWPWNQVLQLWTTCLITLGHMLLILTSKPSNSASLHGWYRDAKKASFLVQLRIHQMNGPRSIVNEEREKEAKTRNYVQSSTVCVLDLYILTLCGPVTSLHSWVLRDTDVDLR